MSSLIRETTWRLSTTKTIEEIYKSLNFLEGEQKASVSINSPNPTKIQVVTDSSFLINTIGKMINSTSLPTSDSMKLFYARTKDKSVFANFGFDNSKIDTDCFGLYDPVEKTALIVGGLGYGLLKSVLYGMASLNSEEMGYYPSHGVVIQINGKGKLLVGHHGAGKTTTLLKLMHHTSEKGCKILTDDWGLFRNENNIILASTLEDKISFKEGFVSEFPELKLKEIFKKNKIDGIPKVYINPKEMYGEDSFVETSIVDSIILLDQRNSQQLIRKANKREVIELLTESAYHMPDAQKDVRDRQIAFWEQASSNCNLVSLDTRFKSNKEAIMYSEIFKVLNS